MTRRRPRSMPPSAAPAVWPQTILMLLVLAAMGVAYLLRVTDWTPLAAEARRAIFRMDIDGTGECTAFGIRTGVLLSAAHCDGTVLTLQDGRRAFTVAKDEKRDLLALLVLPKATDGVLYLDTQEPAVGVPVALYGYPFGFPAPYLRTGIVSLPRDTDEQLGLDIHIAPGDSGSPIVAFNGRVVGVASNHFTRTGETATITYAVALAHVRAFVEKLR